MDGQQHRSHHRVLLRRVLVAGFGALVCALCAASCSGMLGLNDRTSAAFELCDLVDRCFGEDELIVNCEERVSQQLVAASADARSAWLTAFGNRACLETCNNARLCLDTAPVCGPTGADCASDEVCCGFSDNDAACANGRCCHQDGRPCASDDECCEGSCRAGLCGGQQCLVAGQPCEVSPQCCSGICGADALCTDEACLPAGGSCVDGIDCCSGICGENGRCTIETCTPLLGKCGGLDDDSCCNNVACVLVPGAEGFVCLKKCRPTGSTCNHDNECCSGSCDQKRCAGGNNCKAAGKSCKSSGVCCTGLCYITECCGQHECTHGVCSEGGALALHCGCGEQDCGSTSNDTCVAEVCAADPFCCCTRWDEACVTSAGELCGVDCPVMPQ